MLIALRRLLHLMGASSLSSSLQLDLSPLSLTLKLQRVDDPGPRHSNAVETSSSLVASPYENVCGCREEVNTHTKKHAY